MTVIFGLTLLFNTVGVQAAEYSSEIVKSTGYGSVITEEDAVKIFNQIEDLKKKKPSITKGELDKFVIKYLDTKYSKKSVSGNVNLNSYDLPTKGGLNDVETKLFNAHPYQGTQVLYYGSVAKSTTESLYQSSTLYLGNGDAFRHGYWNALMSKFLGQSVAKTWSDAHETYSSGIDKEMDLYNNGVGYRLGQYVSSGSSASVTMSGLRNAVIKYVNNGWMKRIVNNKLTITNSSGRR